MVAVVLATVIALVACLFIIGPGIEHASASQAAPKCSWNVSDRVRAVESRRLLQNCPKWSTAAEGNITNVHIICHTHDDMGWIKTADDYYTGGLSLHNTSSTANKPSQSAHQLSEQNLSKTPPGASWCSVHIQQCGGTTDGGPSPTLLVCRSVHDCTIMRLSGKMRASETGFLTRWVEDHTPEEVEKLRKLVVETGQLEFIGGGWVQPDEAGTHYYDLIDQYTLGLKKLNDSYGPYFHVARLPYLLSIGYFRGVRPSKSLLANRSLRTQQGTRKPRLDGT